MLHGTLPTVSERIKWFRILSWYPGGTLSTNSSKPGRRSSPRPFTARQHLENTFTVGHLVKDRRYRRIFMIAGSCTLSVVMMNDTKIDTYRKVGQAPLTKDATPAQFDDSYFHQWQKQCPAANPPLPRRTSLPIKIYGMLFNKSIGFVPRNMGYLGG